MAQVSLRDLPDDVVERLKARARAHGTSLESELRSILTRSADLGRDDQRCIADALAVQTADRVRSDTVELLREDRRR
ncbi:MAG: FitA-like ribbon-helix-helix domain-containing protein [Gemmatimonadales bacterium]